MSMLITYKGTSTGENIYTLRLFQNDFHPNKKHCIEDFKEATFDGYSPALITPMVREVWWTCGEKTLVYGYYMTGEKDILWAQRFDFIPDLTVGSKLIICPFPSINMNTKLPPGYTIAQNTRSQEYHFRFEDGSLGMFGYKTPEEAIDHAWKVYMVLRNNQMDEYVNVEL